MKRVLVGVVMGCALLIGYGVGSVRAEQRGAAQVATCGGVGASCGGFIFPPLPPCCPNLHCVIHTPDIPGRCAP